MRWFKHMTASSQDEKLSRLKDACGLEGYGFWWSVVEIVAAGVDEKQKTSVTYSFKKWCNLIGIRSQTFRKLSALCAVFDLFAISFDGDYVTIDIPNILKFKDEYTRKSGQAPDKLRTNSGAKQRQNTDTETEKDHTPIGSLENKDHARARSSQQEAYSDEPGIEFVELRDFYDTHCRQEAPLTGFIEYKQLRASRRWPGISGICDAITKHSRADPDGWKQFCPGLVKFLREQWWLKAPSARASPPARDGPPAARTQFQKGRQDMENMAKLAIASKEALQHGNSPANHSGTQQIVRALPAAGVAGGAFGAD